MKKVFLLAMLATASIAIYSCNSSSEKKSPSEKDEKIVTAYAKPKEEPISIGHHKDDISGDEYYGATKSLVLTEGKKGFGIQIIIKKKGSGFYADNIMMNVRGVGACQENDVLYFLFEDGTKEKLTAWNDFNCDGDAYFKLSGSILSRLSKPIKSMRIENGRTFDTYDATLTDDDKNYFSNISEAIKAGRVVEVKELPSF
jgi:hypothetical protein